MGRQVIRIKLLDARAIVPVQRDGDSGSDLHALHNVSVLPGGVARVGFGLALEIPEDHVAIVSPRSGLTSKGLLALCGVVDPGYRGEIGATLHNTTKETWHVKAGDRVSQLVIYPCPRLTFDTAADLTPTDRGAKGWGSSGVGRVPGNGG